MTWGEKKVFIKNNTKIIPKVRLRQRSNTNKPSRREQSIQYFLSTDTERLRVCQKMFVNTLNISQRTVLNWIITRNDITNTPAVESGDLNLPMPRSAKGVIKTNLKNFFESLPKMESHYCRASSSKLYLEPNWQSKAELYKEYKEKWCKEKGFQHVAMTTFSRAFETLNLSLFRPKKDECDTCVAYKTKNISEEEYLCHQKRKENARDEKQKDKEDSKFVISMDLQSVLLCPKSNVSCLYYKTKLVVHNFTIYDLKNNNGYCFLWHEGEGGLTAHEFSSIICYFILKHVIPVMNENNRVIIIYSDGCTYQNRNVTLSNALLNLSAEENITIIQKFLEKGHTQMEVDSMHSAIERKLKNRTIYVPANYIDVCKEARNSPRPYEVEYLNHSFFKNFDTIKYVKSIRPGEKSGDPKVTEIRAIKYIPEKTILYKLDFEEDWTILSQRIQNLKAINFDNLPNLYHEPLNIKKQKFEHLQSLKYIMPSDYHSFYDKLQYS